MTHDFSKLLRYIVIAGNFIFILWMTFNGIDEGFRAPRIQVFSYLGLVFLLVLNIFLLLKTNDKQSKAA